VGWGGSNDSPFLLDIPEKHALEVGFLKLFLTTEYVDFSDVPQASPFSSCNNRAMKIHSPSISFWESIKIPFVLRRANGVGAQGDKTVGPDIQISTTRSQ